MPRFNVQIGPNKGLQYGSTGKQIKKNKSRQTKQKRRQVTRWWRSIYINSGYHVDCRSRRRK